jgi:hypothetical protein
LAVAWREALKAGTAAEVLPIKMRWLGGVETPVTPQHFLTYKDVIGKAVTRPKPVERSTRICLSIYRGTAATLGFAKAAVSSP